MVEQACFFVAGVFLDQCDLMDHVIECLRFIESERVFGEERSCHVDAIQPHLIRIDLLVPETVGTIARMGAHLFTQVLDGPGITLIAGALVGAV